MRKIHIDLLRPDMLLGKPIYKENHIMITSGTNNLQRYAPRLQALGISHLYIEDSASEGIDIEDPISEETRVKCKETIKKSFSQLKSNFTLDTGLIIDMSENLLEEILSHPSVLISLNEIGDIGDNTLDHSVNTTIYAICLAQQLGYHKSKILDLAFGTLLHDVGKTALNSTILFKPSKLTEEEFEYIKTHTTLGYDILFKDKRIPESSKQICLSHHERVDGSGYPNGLRDNAIPEFAKIVSIVDVYEALTVNRCYHRAVPPQRALDILTEEASSKLDPYISSVFLQNVAVYPNGTTVLLSDGQYGIVKQQNLSFPLRPVVRVLKKGRGITIPIGEVDLMKTLNVTIIGSDVDVI